MNLEKKEQVEIQERIVITQKEVDRTIEFYKGMPDTFGFGILEVTLDREGVIKEIKKLSEVGKAILLMRHKFNIWLKKEMHK